MLPDIFPLGPFLVEEDGKLSFRLEGSRPGFSFMWRNRRFKAVLADGSMALSGVLGQVPSSATGPERRELALGTLRGLPKVLPRNWVLRLRPDHRLQLELEEAMEWPANVSALIQPIVKFLLMLAPYLDLLDEAGLR